MPKRYPEWVNGDEQLLNLYQNTTKSQLFDLVCHLIHMEPDHYGTNLSSEEMVNRIEEEKRTLKENGFGSFVHGEKPK